MLRAKLLILGSLAGCLALSTAQAQVTVDMSKITCDQFVQHKVSNPRSIAIWLSGFYAGKRNNSVVDVQTLERDADRVTAYCVSNRNMVLMQAVETTLGMGTSVKQ
jgi:acid stress chaperone HdeB